MMSTSNGIESPRKLYRLLSGMKLQVWSPSIDDDEIKRVAVLGIQNGFNGVIEFTEDDIPTIVAALNDALKRGRGES